MIVYHIKILGGGKINENKNKLKTITEGRIWAFEAEKVVKLYFVAIQIQ